MPTKLSPYLGFQDNARQAMEFYHSIFGGDLALNTFKESNASQDPSEDEKIMHAALHVSELISFMASDTPNGMDRPNGSAISMSLNGDNDEELTSYFNKLAEGGTITLPLEQAPWGDKFGMVKDQFGINWMVNISPVKA